jgi:hypothetical protein
VFVFCVLLPPLLLLLPPFLLCLTESTAYALQPVFSAPIDWGSLLNRIHMLRCHHFCCCLSQGMGHREAGIATGVPQVPGVTVGPGAIHVSAASTASVAAAAVDSLFVGQMQPPGAAEPQQQHAAAQ